MKKYIPLLVVSLFISLLIYVFYRTENTLVNQIIIRVFSRDGYMSLKTAITFAIPLKDYVIYSLPEGLWVFCITVTSSFFYVEVWGHKFKLAIIPICLALTMELFQLLHFANGRFDIMDILFAVVFWLLALLWTRKNFVKERIFQNFNSKTVFCMMSYTIVYMAHVCY